MERLCSFNLLSDFLQRKIEPIDHDRCKAGNIRNQIWTKLITQFRSYVMAGLYNETISKRLIEVEEIPTLHSSLLDNPENVFRDPYIDQLI